MKVIPTLELDAVDCINKFGEILEQRIKVSRKTINNATCFDENLAVN